MGEAISANLLSFLQKRKSGKTGDNVGELLAGRHCDIVVVMFRMEIDIDFRVRRSAETRSSQEKPGALSSRLFVSSEGDRSEGVKATGWSLSTFVVPSSSELG